MKKYVSDIAFTPAVKSWQETLGSRMAYERMAEKVDWKSQITQQLADFIARRDSFYLATANAEGQPYIQHRGGPKGFLKIIDEDTLAFADYSGNRQYISAGNLSENNKVHLFFMDYPNRARIKLWGEAYTDNDTSLIEKVMDTGYKARPERVIVIKVKAWDINCPQHITQRFTLEEVEEMTQELRDKVKALESQLAVFQKGEKV